MTTILCPAKWQFFLLLVWLLLATICSFSLPDPTTNSKNAIPSLESLVKLQEGETAVSDVDTGTLIWDAGRALANHLVVRFPQPRLLEQNCRVLELGAGTGIVGLTAAKLGASWVVLTDKPDLMPLLEQNIAENDLSDKVKAAVLFWGDKEAGEELLGGKTFDIVCGSDLLYAAESFEPLIETLQQFCEPGKTQVWLAYPTRFTEQVFFEQVYQCGFDDVEMREEIEPAIYLSKLIRRK